MSWINTLKICGRYNHTWKPIPLRGPYGISGLEMEVDGEKVSNYNYSSSYEIKEETLVPKLDGSYSLIILGENHIGLKEIPGSLINISWYEADADPLIVIEAWNKYIEIIPLDRIIKYLVLRDIISINIYNFITAMPSWDICLMLPLYAGLCRKIPGLNERLEIHHEISDEIRGILDSLENLLRSPPKGQRGYCCMDSRLENLLRAMHSLTDELALAYHINKLGYNIEFGGAGEPDFFINGISAENKSRTYHSRDQAEEKDLAYYPVTGIINNLKNEVKSSARAFKKSDIFFSNVSRVPSALDFYSMTESSRFERDGTQIPSSNLFYNFDLSLTLAIIKAHYRKEKTIIPYIKPFCSRPQILSLPVINWSI